MERKTSNKCSLFIRSMKKLKNAMLAAVIILTIVIVGLCCTYKYMMGPVSKSKDIVNVEIPSNTSVKGIAKILKNNNLIRNEKFFVLYTKLFKVDGFKAGYYDISKNSDIKDIVEKLKNGSTHNPNEIKLTFKEGVNIRKIATIISENTNNSYESVIEKTKDNEYLDKVIEKYWFLTDEIKNNQLFYGLEGYLFPETYIFDNKDVTVEEVFNKMLSQTDKVLSEYKDMITNNSLSVHQILTLASMIEKEAGRDEERSSIASVFLNRINKGMSLGSDVTARYANQIDDNKQKLTKEQFNINSPYNTRLTDGTMNGKLPVGPICNPSKESIFASLNPEQSNYIYFIANIETKETFFYDNYSDFEKKKVELDKVNKGL